MEATPTPPTCSTSSSGQTGLWGADRQPWRDCSMNDDMKAPRRAAQIAFLLTALATPAFAQTVRIDATLGHAINAFDPDSALGSSIDVLSRTDINKVSWSNFVSDETYEIKGYTSTYFAAHMINLEWVQHRAGIHHMFPSSSDITDADG